MAWAGRQRLGELIGREVLSEISVTKDPDTASRVSQLEQTLFEAQEAPRRASAIRRSPRTIRGRRTRNRARTGKLTGGAASVRHRLPLQWHPSHTDGLTCENAARRNCPPRWMRTADGALMRADVIEAVDARQLFS
jgi:hypothetical protein